MQRERDSQRSKVYAAERSVEGFETRDRMETISEIEHYVEKVITSAWFQRRWKVKGYRIEDGRGARRATGGLHWGGVAVLTFPKWSRSKMIVLHELAHACTVKNHGGLVSAHGWQFASTYLELVTHEMGKETGDALKAAFRAKKVRFARPRQKRELTEEQKQVLRDRMAKARAARKPVEKAEPEVDKERLHYRKLEGRSHWEISDYRGVLGTVKGTGSFHFNTMSWAARLPDGTSIGSCSRRLDAAEDLQYHRDRLDRQLAEEQAALEGAAA